MKSFCTHSTSELEHRAYSTVPHYSLWDASHWPASFLVRSEIKQLEEQLIRRIAFRLNMPLKYSRRIPFRFIASAKLVLVRMDERDVVVSRAVWILLTNSWNLDKIPAQASSHAR